MSNIFKTNISKETFKTANTQCIKQAWVFHSIQNFKTTLEFSKNKKYFFNLDNDLESEDDYNSNATNINLFEDYVFSDLKTDKEKELIRQKLEESILSDDGFSLEEFQGDAIEDGKEFGQKAIEFFEIEKRKNHPNKLTKSFNEITKTQQAVKETKELLEKYQDKYIYLYEPAFEYDNFNLKVRCDILKLLGDNRVEIIEAKATSSVKKEHFWDLVYQAYVLEKNGYIVENIKICKLNRDYLHAEDLNYYFDFKKELADLDDKHSDGKISFDKAKEVVENIDNLNLNFKDLDDTEDLDIEKLVSLDELTFGESKNRVTLFQDYQNLKNFINLDELFYKISEYLSLNENEILSIFNNESCYLQITKTRSRNAEWTNWELGEKSACKHVLKYFDQTIEGWWQLTGKNKDKRAFLIKELPSPYFKDYNTLNDVVIDNLVDSKTFFNKDQERIFEVAKYEQEILNDESLMIKDENYDFLKQELKKYQKYPIFMYDFETVKFAVPRFYRTNPYHQTPFQYSIHIINDDNYDYNDEQTMKHYQFLSDSKQDPRKGFVIQFLKDIFENDPGVYVAYNKSFEQRVLKCLACLFPELELPLLYVVNNTIDLIDFFKGKKGERPSFLIANKNFHGLTSIKKTQPALDPHFTYKMLTINNGGKASEMFRRFLEDRLDDQLWDQTFKQDMINYCNRDTLAMVVILKRVFEITRKWEKKHGK
ncbi:DUF2779 domain-containing protein [Mycoplasma sp. HU2014]|uniref:DUF2779 domain-containing protein n=1 Tax=Mycoplasma sp. HU2014 TaxID=1664275 RepID=UPI00067C268D|nr:DUF2779 domain-containing protein [Mycoplasma sp. HU2014]KNG79599.1 hypothetical protein AB668_01145 [Mycoplasma sp. HU2014]